MSENFSNIITLQNKNNKITPKTISLDNNITDEVTAMFLITTLNLSVNTLNQELVIGEKTVYPKSSVEIIGSAERIKKSSVATAFLNKHRELDILLALIEYKIVEYFGNVQIHLECLDEKRLSLFIGLTCAPEEALEKLYNFYDDWWLNNSYLVKGMLNIDVVPI